jgi:glucose/arabinose dehydrogenase
VRRLLGIALAAALLLAAPAAAAPRLEALGSFATPVGIAAPPGDASRVMVVEKAGTVRMLRDGVRVADPFLDLTSIVSSSASERGLLSIAFPPDYQQTGLFYVFLTAKAAAAASGEGEVQIRELHRADADHAAPGLGRVVFSYPHSAPNHNGGQLQFGPDGLLWFTIGDNANGANAQNAAVPYGKLNRIDPRTSGPASVWASGLRNPWRFSFDRSTHDLWIGDVGENTYEEIDHASAPGLGQGANYGWPCREGLHAGPGSGCGAGPFVDPVVEQTHTDGWHAIIGGYVVRDPGLPSLAGRYLYGDYSQPVLYALDPSNPRPDTPTGLSVSGLTALGEDACGRLYTAAYGGSVSRIVDGTPSPCSFPAPPPGPGGTPPGTTPPDTQPCTLALAARGTGRVTIRRYLRLRMRSDERCRVTVSGRLPGVARFRTTHRSLPAGRTVTVKLWLTPAANRRLRQAVRGRRSARVRVRVRGVDAAGNVRVLTRRVRVYR